MANASTNFAVACREMFDGGLEGHKKVIRHSQWGNTPSQKVAELAFGLRPPKTDPTPELAKLVDWGKATLELCSSEFGSRVAGVSLRLLNTLSEKPLRDLQQIARECAAAVPALKAFEQAMQFFQTRPLAVSRAWFSELVVATFEEVHLAHHASSGPWKDSPEMLSRMRSQIDHDGLRRRYIADRERAGVRNACDALSSYHPDSHHESLRTIAQAIRNLDVITSRAKLKTTDFTTIRALGIIKQYVEDFAPRVLPGPKVQAVLDNLSELLAGEKMLRDWLVPGLLIFPPGIESSAPLSRRPYISYFDKRHGALHTSQHDLLYTVSKLDHEMRRYGASPERSNAAFSNRVSAALYEQRAQLAANLPQGAPVQLLQFNGAFDIFPSSLLLDQVMDLQRRALVTGGPDTPSNGLRTVVPRAEIEEKLRANKGILYLAERNGEVLGLYLLCPAGAGRNPTYGSVQAEPSELLKELQQRFGHEVPNQVAAELAVSRRSPESSSSVVGRNIYSVLHEAVCGLVANEFQWADSVEIVGAVRIEPQPNTAVSRHLERGLALTGETVQMESGGEMQTFALLKMVISSPERDAFGLYKAGLLV